MKIAYSFYLKDNFLNLAHMFSLKDFNPEDIFTNNITGFRIGYKAGDDYTDSFLANSINALGYSKEDANKLATSNSKYIETTIFIGRIVDFDEIKQHFNELPSEEEQKCKYAVSYDEEGNIFDVRPCIAPDEPFFAVSNKEELLEAYKNAADFNNMTENTNKEL